MPPREHHAAHAAEPNASGGTPQLLSHHEVERIISGAGVLAHLSDIVSIVDAQMRFLYVSRVVGERSAEGVLGSDLTTHMTPASQPAFVRAFREGWREREVRVAEGASVDDRWWETRLVPITDGVATRYMLAISVDISARKLAEAAAHESESRLRDAIEVSGIGTWRWSRDPERVSWDSGMCRILGVPEDRAPGNFEAYAACLHPDDRARVVAHVLRAVETGIYDEVEHRVVRPSGEVRTISCRGTVVRDPSGAFAGMHGAVFDVTERRALEERVRHAQKMEAIGQLTAGIAHNFNNLLSIVLPNVELARPYAALAAQPRLDDIEHAAQRAADLVRQLMLFARHELASVKADCDLGSIARSTVRICRSTFDPRIAIALTVEEDLPPIRAAGGEIEQVLLNICINARDALDPKTQEDPTIRIEVARHGPGFARIRIADNGQGMDEPTRARVFEPFFSTKGVGRGTGLGLASAYGIIHDHAGAIRCESTPMVGTSFVIDLPLREGASTPAHAARSSVRYHGTETLLLVDDEPMVRRALAAVLESAGFTVLLAEDGEQGIAVLEGHPEVKLVLLDRAMPRASGDQFLVRLRRHDRHTPVLLLTGQPGLDADAIGASAVLLKPPSTADLLQGVRRLLDAAHGQNA